MRNALDSVRENPKNPLIHALSRFISNLGKLMEESVRAIILSCRKTIQPLPWGGHGLLIDKHLVLREAIREMTVSSFDGLQRGISLERADDALRQ